MAALGNLAMLPIDPMRLIPIVGNLALGIIRLADKIANKVKDVKAHRNQCIRLSQRINRIVDYLNSMGFQEKINPYSGALKGTLESFYTFLHECDEYISLFEKMWWIQQFLHSQDHKEQFEHFNHQLALFMTEMIMGLNIDKLVDINKHQDDEDRAEDVKELLVSMKDQEKIKNYQPKGSFDRRVYQARNPHRARYTDPQRRELHAANPGPLSDHIFVSGTWSLRYSQNGVWHGPFQHKMMFHTNNRTFDGQGENNVGQFTMTGTYSKDTNRIDIIQLYKYGTGNSQLNGGHQCRFELMWDKEKRRFQGINYAPIARIMVPLGKIQMSLVSAA